MANEFIIKNGFHSKGNSQITGSLSITGISDVSASIAAASGGGGGSSGKLGISDANGAYTYYTDLSSSMAAASSGDTIEVFADVIDESGKTVYLKNKVDINLNGHTYQFQSASAWNPLTDNASTISCNIFNGVIAMSGSTGTLLKMGASGHNSTVRGDVILTANDTSTYIVDYNTSTAGYKLSGFTIIGENNADGLRSSNFSKIDNVKIFTADGNGAYINVGEMRSSFIQTTGGTNSSYGVHVLGYIAGCTITVEEGYGVSLQANPNSSYETGVHDCSIYSNGNTGINATGNAPISNTTIITQGNLGFSSAGQNGSACYIGRTTTDPVKITNCTFRSVNVAAIYSYIKPIILANCTVISEGDAVITGYDNSNFYLQAKDCFIQSDYDNADGNGIELTTSTNNEIVDCFIQTAGSGANALTPIGSSALTGLFADNQFKGMTTPINTLVTQSFTNVPDEQGNMHITSSLNNNRVYSGSFSGSYVGDGSGLTGVSAFPFSGDAKITGSLDVSGSITTFDINMSTWTLGADGGSNYYYFTGPGDLAGTEQNPDIHLTRGQKYRFYNPMDAHPFQIQDLGGSAFSTGVTNNGVQLGFLSFDVPMDGPTHLKYQCTSHGAMVGNIYIADARVASGSFSGSFQGDGSSLTGLSAFPFTGDAQITGSLNVSGSFVPHGIGPTSNTVIGESAGAALTSGATENIMIGKEAGEAQASGDSNIMIGIKAGEASTNDSRCILIGRKAGGGSTLGNDNIFVGYEAGRDASAVNDSIGIGYQALFESNNGADFNLGIGRQVGYSLTTGTYNVLLGHQAGYNLTTGASNIIIGSGSLAETGTTNQLRIGHGSSPIISASLSTGHVKLEGSTGGLELIGSGSTLFNIIGSEGTLFSIEDDLDGTLFTVNDRSGIPMFEVSASGRIVAEEGESIIRSQRPIVTHTADFSITSSLDFAGKYHIVGGGITCSINTGSLVPTGAEFEFFQTSSVGNFLFITGSPHVDLIAKNDNRNLAGRGSGATLKYVGGSTFHLVGDLT